MKINDKESIYVLKSPKIIINTKVSVSNIKVTDSFTKLEEGIINFPQTKIANSINTSSKFDKKYKGSSADTLDIKKNKNKLNKKHRKNIAINIDSQDLLNDDTTHLPVIKQPKLNKNRKKDKHKDLDIIIDNYKLNNNTDTNKVIAIDAPLTIQELSNKLCVPEAEIITYLFLKGIAVTVNQVIDINMAQDIAKYYQFQLVQGNLVNDLSDIYTDESVLSLSKSNSMNTRYPIITVFGHVDHGKTTLLDAILNTQSVSKEYGGITQAINSYQIQWDYNAKHYNLVFLDTPGHEAFVSMRLRSARVADLALLVVAADDGLKPQTVEVIQLILSLKLSYIIIINKIDKPDINIDKIKQEMTDYGIISKEWGGDGIFVEVSALKNQNIDILLSEICALTDRKSLFADSNLLAQGTILESYLDKKKGIIAKSLIQNGTLQVGDLIVSGNTSGRVKSLIDESCSQLIKAGPASIINILGFIKMPEAGLNFQVVMNDKEVKKLINEYNHKYPVNSRSRLLNNRISLNHNDNVNIVNMNNLNVILKTDTQGSLEALINSLYAIPQTKVQLNLIAYEPGNINRNDIDLAITSKAILVGFNIQPVSEIVSLVKKYTLELRTFYIIYDLLDYIHNSMLNLVDPEYESVIIGHAIVQTVFSINKGAVAGCLVQSGKLQKNSHIRVYRDNNIVHEGILDSLKRIKQDVEEVSENNECGVMCNTYYLWQSKDRIEAYELQAKDKQL